VAKVRSVLNFTHPLVWKEQARSNASQWGTHIRRRNRKYSDAVVAVVRPVAGATRVLAN